MIFPGHSDQKNESARKIHFDLYKKIIKKFWKRKKLEVIKVRKKLVENFRDQKKNDFFSISFFIHFWMKIFEIFEIENFSGKKRKFFIQNCMKMKIFEIENFRTLITSNFFHFKYFLMIFFPDLESKSSCGFIFAIYKCWKWS